MIGGIECNLCCMLAAGRSRTHRYAELEMRTAATHSVLSVCLLVTTAQPYRNGSTSIGSVWVWPNEPGIM